MAKNLGKDLVGAVVDLTGCGEMPTCCPGPMQAIARGMSDAQWDADIGRLASAIGLPRQRSVWPWTLGGAAAAASAIASLWPRRPPLRGLEARRP